MGCNLRLLMNHGYKRVELDCFTRQNQYCQFTWWSTRNLKASYHYKMACKSSILFACYLYISPQGKFCNGCWTTPVAHAQILLPSVIRKQAPRYEFAFDTLNPLTRHYHCPIRNIRVFEVEQGRRFFMKFKLTAYPRPADADLYKDGKLVQSTNRGTIFVGADSIGVQLVDKRSYTGNYRISSRNEMGSGHITFRIEVQRKLHF